MPRLAELIFKYFWIIAAFSWVANYLMLKTRIPKTIKDETEKEEVNGLLKSFLFLGIFSFGLLGVLQILGGFQNLFFVFSRDYKNIYVVLAWIVLLITWGITLRWVFFDNGAKLLIKYQGVFGGNLPNDANKVKIYLVMMMLGGLLVLIIGISQDLYAEATLILPK